MGRINWVARRVGVNGVRILGTRTVEYMTRNHLPFDAGLRQDFHHFDHTINPAMAIVDGHSALSMWDRMDHGFGVAVAPQDTLDLQTVQSPGEYGWGGAFSTMFFVDPVEQIVMVYMMQSPGDHSLPARHTKRGLRVAVHQAILTDPPEPAPLGTSDTVAARL